MVTIDNRDGGFPSGGWLLGGGVGVGLGAGAGFGSASGCTLTTAPAPIRWLASMTVTRTDVSLKTFGAMKSPSLEIVPAVADQIKTSGRSRVLRLIGCSGTRAKNCNEPPEATLALSGRMAMLGCSLLDVSVVLRGCGAMEQETVKPASKLMIAMVMECQLRGTAELESLGDRRRVITKGLVLTLTVLDRNRGTRSCESVRSVRRMY